MSVAEAEVVAAFRGLPVEESAYREESMGWVVRTKPPADGDLIALTSRALQRVAAPESELADPVDTRPSVPTGEGV